MLRTAVIGLHKLILVTSLRCRIYYSFHVTERKPIKHLFLKCKKKT